jgi:steroid delta-isomerase-like uncharacterized protein
MANIIEVAKAAIVAYNDKDWDKAKELFAAEAAYDEKATHRRIEGISQIINVWQSWASAISDLKATIVREFATIDGSIVMMEVVWKGVHTGPLQTSSSTIPASNKPIEVPACLVIEIASWKVKIFTHYFDMMTLLSQIGAAKG